MGDVISQDFGKADREHARCLAELLRLVAVNDADILANPGKYLAMAGARLTACERFIDRLYEAINLPWCPSAHPFVSEMLAPFLPEPTVRIDRRDYEALQAVKLLIENAWLYRLASPCDVQPVDRAGDDVDS